MQFGALVPAWSFVLAALAIAACHHGSDASPPRNPSRAGGASNPPVSTAPSSIRRGTLVTYINGTPLGREQFTDDGTTLHADITMPGARFAVAIGRSPRSARVSQGEHSVDRDVGADTVVFENGDWQSLAVAAEWFPDSATPRNVTVLLPARDTRVQGQFTVQPTAGREGHRDVALVIEGLQITAEIDAVGNVVRAAVPAQHVEVLPEGVEPTRRAAAPVPAHVTERPVEVLRDGVALRGVLWRPANATGPTPVVVFIAGSGPTDRDCNQEPLLRTDTFRLMASALAEHGISSLRYDKRGVGQSGRNFAPADATLNDFVADALAIVDFVRHDPQTASVTLAGHSEGGLVAILAARTAPVDGMILLASPGRAMGVILREQLARQLDATMMAEADRAIAAIRAGQPIGEVSQPLRVLFNPTVAGFVRSILDVDPAAAFHSLRVPATIVQGETDAQVSIADARALAAARPDAHLVLIPRANHVFKVEESSALPQASYSNPDLPLAPGVMDAMIAAIPHANGITASPSPSGDARGHRRRHPAH